MRLLFVCSQNQLRSPTAEAVFSEYEGLEVDSAGLDRGAVYPLTSDAVQWADINFCHGKGASPKASPRFSTVAKE